MMKWILPYLYKENLKISWRFRGIFVGIDARGLGQVRLAGVHDAHHDIPAQHCNRLLTVDLLHRNFFARRWRVTGFRGRQARFDDREHALEHFCLGL